MRKARCSATIDNVPLVAAKNSIERDLLQPLGFGTVLETKSFEKAP